MSDVEPTENVAPTAEEYALYADEGLASGFSISRPPVERLPGRWEREATLEGMKERPDTTKIAMLRRCAQELRDVFEMGEDASFRRGNEYIDEALKDPAIQARVNELRAQPGKQRGKPDANS